MKFVSVCFVALPASLVFAQGFEVASVKPGPPGVVQFSMNGGPLEHGPFNMSGNDPGRIAWTNVPLKRMIKVAYDVAEPDRISGPDWLQTARYTTEAVVPAGTSVSDFRLMVQRLLAERFGLVVHRETKEFAGYGLEIAKNGPKLETAKGDARNASRRDGAAANAVNPGARGLIAVDDRGFPIPTPGNPVFDRGAVFEAAIRVNGRIRASGLNETMSGFAVMLGRFAGAPVVDRTGLTGMYDVHLEFLPDDATNADPGPDVFAAVQAQLGLRLVAQKVPVEILVIDHAEKVPTAN
jgi:uncharacterized protein (TIGR03435 family)